MHGQERSVEDVDFVNLLWGNHAHGPSQRVALYLLAELVTPLLAELLGVVEPLVAVVLGQDDRGGKHRPGQASPSGLVETGLHHVRIQIG